MVQDRVEEAFRAVPRERFLPRRLRRQSGYDGPLPIGHGQTNSQPRTVADMLRLLDVRPGHRVLDVGSGSGWTTALLAHLTGPTGEVHGVEVVETLATWGATNLSAADMPWASIHLAEPGVLGRPADAPYDRILVSADGGRLPEELVDQLVVGGAVDAVERDDHPTGGGVAEPPEIALHGDAVGGPGVTEREVGSRAPVDLP
jgi:protein-L-isoaspartate(D-aspartate) O-methyltransferase